MGRGGGNNFLKSMISVYPSLTFFLSKFAIFFCQYFVKSPWSRSLSFFGQIQTNLDNSDCGLQFWSLAWSTKKTPELGRILFLHNVQNMIFLFKLVCETWNRQLIASIMFIQPQHLLTIFFCIGEMSRILSDNLFSRAQLSGCV